MDFPSGSDGKESACYVGDPSMIPGSGRYPGKGNGYPLQYSGLENFMDYIVHGAAKSRTFTFHSQYDVTTQGKIYLSPQDFDYKQGEVFSVS